MSLYPPQFPATAKHTYFATLGRYYICQTGLAGDSTIAAGASISDTSPFLLMFNASKKTDATIPAANVILDYLKLVTVTPGTNGTNLQYTTKLDTGPSRYSSAGTARDPVNCNIDSTLASVIPNHSATAPGLYTGAIVATAANAARVIGAGVMRAVIPVANDTYVLDFGGASKGAAMSAIGAGMSLVVLPHAPVVIGPQENFLLHLASASQTVAATYMLETGWHEEAL